MKRDAAFYKRLIAERLEKLERTTPDNEQLREIKTVLARKEHSLDVLRACSQALGLCLRADALGKRVRRAAGRRRTREQ
jgi:hypothetical protein